MHAARYIFGLEEAIISWDITLAVIGSLNPIMPKEGRPGLTNVEGKPIGVLAVPVVAPTPGSDTVVIEGDLLSSPVTQANSVLQFGPECF